MLWKNICNPYKISNDHNQEPEIPEEKVIVVDLVNEPIPEEPVQVKHVLAPPVKEAVPEPGINAKSSSI